MAKPFDVIVVGIGSMGASACWHLAKRGLRVLGLEQGPIPNPEASFAGLTRAIRLSYAEHPDYVPLLQGAYKYWEVLEEESGEELLRLTGALYMGPSAGELVNGASRSAKEHGLAHTLYSHAELQENWPQFQLPDSFEGLYEDRAGYLLSERAVEAFVDEARKHGADLRGGQMVVNWTITDSGVKVQVGANEYFAEHLVITAGAWTGKILKDLSLPLRVTRQVLGWVPPPNPNDFTADKFPVWVIDGNNGEGVHYGFPITPDGSGGEGLKLALHWPGKEVDPGTVIRDKLPDDDFDIQDALARYLPSGKGPLLSQRVCLYTNSPDGHFIVDRHPEFPQVSLACGFSGHGFKFSSVMGEVLADLATNGKTDWPIGFLGLSRFTR